MEVVKIVSFCYHQCWDLFPLLHYKRTYESLQNIKFHSLKNRNIFKVNFDI